MMSSLAYASSAMRQEALKWASNKEDNIAMNGKGYGSWFGGEKLAGGWLLADGKTPGVEPFGGFQGGPGMLFGSEYAPGGVRDFVLEAFAGPHDFLDAPINNIAQGLQKSFSPFGEVASYAYSGLMIPVAAPFAVSAMVMVSPATQSTLLTRGLYPGR